ncbi:MAG: beta-galactosidase, partial [Paramuribaculum sp.]|nr:beta-galactosidase [Paramuribaculum sp.]
MKIADILGVSLLLIACNIFCCPVSGREILNFNTDWAFHRGDHPEGASPLISDADWIPAVIPHVMQLEKKHCGGDIIYDGVGWYRRSFTVAPETEGKRVAIHFEGVMTNCSVFLNGDSIASHHGGYLGFTVDITDRVKRGEPNLLAVRVDASHDPLTPPGKPQADMDFYYYSGIYRDVSLVVTDPVFVTDPLKEDVEAGGGVFVS